MSQYDLQISDLERIFRKQYKIILFSIVLSVIFSIFFAKMKAPLYQTSSTVKIDRNSLMTTESLLVGAWDNIETQTKVIKSFPVLLRASKILKYVPDSITDDTHISDEILHAKIVSILQKISINITSGTNIIEITATSSDPVEAREIANAIAYAYKEYSISVKKLHATQTKEFITEQLKISQQDLATIEDKIKFFEESQKIPLIEVNAQRIIDEELKIESQIAAIDNEILTLKLQEEDLNNWFERKTFVNTFLDSTTLTKRMKTTSKTSDSMNEHLQSVALGLEQDPGLAQLNNRLIDFQLQRDDQRSFYTEEHPTIKDIDSKIQKTINQILSRYSMNLSDLNSQRSRLSLKKQEIDEELRQIPTNQMSYTRLKRQLEVTEQLNTVLTTRLQEALIADAGMIDDVTILSLATLATIPVNKNALKFAGVGLFLGVLLGIIFAIIREIFDTSISTIKDVEQTLKLTVLAVIPFINTYSQVSKQKKGKNIQTDEIKSLKNNSILTTHFNPKIPTSEAYRILRTNIELILSTKPVKTILVTSAAMQEGKSTTIANLAVVFSQQGKKTLLLEFNLRRPSFQKIFGYDQGPGITDILVGKFAWHQCVVSVTDIALGQFTIDDILITPGLDNLFILPSGQTPLNPTELISSNKMNSFLDEIKDNFDFILVDGPPLLPVADSIILSKKVDGVVLVYRVGKTPRNSLRLAKDRLLAVQANVLGLVLNGIRPETTGSEYAIRPYISQDKKDIMEKKFFSIKSKIPSKYV